MRKLVLVLAAATWLVGTELAFSADDSSRRLAGCSASCMRPGSYPVEHPGMEPTLHCPVWVGGRYRVPHCEGRRSGVRVRAVWSAAGPRRFDIVVAGSPPTRRREGGCYETPLRVVGLPGDVWAERRGFVYIDGKLLDEPYVHRDRRDGRTLSLADIPHVKTSRIPEGEYLLMGDNRSVACDSRTWGLVSSRAHNVLTVVEIDDWRGGPTGRPARGYTPR